jgi:OOP family OmpA-OmpF porin
MGTWRLLRGAFTGVALLAASCAVLARDGWYAGLTLGASNAKIDDSVVDVAGAAATRFSSDKRDPGFKVLAGYRFGPRWAAEGGYTHLGEFRATRDVSAPAAGSVNADLRVKGLHADVLAMLPFARGFEAFAKAGALLSEVKTFRATSGTVTPVSAPGSRVTDEINPKFGLGLRYEIARNASLRLEWERYTDVGNDSTGEIDVDLYSVGMQWRF